MSVWHIQRFTPSSNAVAAAVLLLSASQLACGDRQSPGARGDARRDAGVAADGTPQDESRDGGTGTDGRAGDGGGSTTTSTETDPRCRSNFAGYHGAVAVAPSALYPVASDSRAGRRTTSRLTDGDAQTTVTLDTGSLTVKVHLGSLRSLVGLHLLGAPSTAGAVQAQVTVSGGCVHDATTEPVYAGALTEQLSFAAPVSARLLTVTLSGEAAALSVLKLGELQPLAQVGFSSTPAEYAVEGMAYHYRPTVDFAGHRIESLRLAQTPSGATLSNGARPEARTVDWTPTHAQGGAQTFVLQAALGDDIVEQRFVVQTATRTKLATVTLGPDGATQTVSRTGTAIDGMTLSVPAGTLDALRPVSIYRVEGPTPALWPGQQPLFFPLVLAWDDAAGLPADGLRVNLSLPVADSAIPAGFERSGLRFFDLMAPVSHAGHSGATVPMPLLTLIDDPMTVAHLTAHLMLAAGGSLIQTTIGSYYALGGAFPIYWARADDDPAPEQITAYMERIGDDLATSQASAQSLNCRPVQQLDTYVVSLIPTIAGSASSTNPVFVVNKANVIGADATATVAHEYFHIIQNNYAYGSSEGFHSEAQATYFAELVFDDINVYRSRYGSYGSDIVERWLNDLSDLVEYQRVTYYQHLKTRGKDNPCAILQAGADYASGNVWPDNGWLVALERQLGGQQATVESVLGYTQALYYKRNELLDEITELPWFWRPQQLTIDPVVGLHEGRKEDISLDGGHYFTVNIHPAFYGRELELQVRGADGELDALLFEIQAADDPADVRLHVQDPPSGEWVPFTAAQGDLLVSLVRTNLSERFADSFTAVTVRVPTFTIRGTVTDASGQPAAGIDIIATYEVGEPITEYGKPIVSGVTDDKGNYEVEVFANLGTVTLSSRCKFWSGETLLEFNPRRDSQGEYPPQDGDMTLECALGYHYATSTDRAAAFSGIRYFYLERRDEGSLSDALGRATAEAQTRKLSPTLTNYPYFDFLGWHLFGTVRRQHPDGVNEIVTRIYNPGPEAVLTPTHYWPQNGFDAGLTFYPDPQPLCERLSREDGGTLSAPTNPRAELQPIGDYEQLVCVHDEQWGGETKTIAVDPVDTMCPFGYSNDPLDSPSELECHRMVKLHVTLCKDYLGPGCPSP